MAFEDAETLAYTLSRATDAQSLTSLLPKWHTHRKLRIQRVLLFTNRSGDLRRSNSDVSEQTIKEWALWHTFYILAQMAVPGGCTNTTPRVSLAPFDPELGLLRSQHSRPRESSWIRRIPLALFRLLTGVSGLSFHPKTDCTLQDFSDIPRAVRGWRWDQSKHISSSKTNGQYKQCFWRIGSNSGVGGVMRLLASIRCRFGPSKTS